MASVTISSDFFVHAKSIFWNAIDTAKHDHVSREEINVFTHDASPAYICCVAAVEAFVNEIFFGLPTFQKLKESPLSSINPNWLERLELKHKLILFPQLLVGDTFDRGAQPYHDMSILIRLRNVLVHYKMDNAAPPYIQDLEARGYTIQPNKEGADYIWVHKISCTEGIRWAINTSAKSVHSLVDFIREGATVPSFLRLADNFQEISKDQVRDRIREIQEGANTSAP